MVLELQWALEQTNRRELIHMNKRIQKATEAIMNLADNYELSDQCNQDEAELFGFRS